MCFGMGLLMCLLTAIYSELNGKVEGEGFDKKVWGGVSLVTR